VGSTPTRGTKCEKWAFAHFDGLCTIRYQPLEHWVDLLLALFFENVNSKAKTGKRERPGFQDMAP
jgi:hypothetical protein